MTTSAGAILVVAPAVPIRGAPENPGAHAWKATQENVAGHQLTVLHDDGLYKHLRMAESGTRMWSWEMVTWPGHLATSGDIGDGYTFSRELDMIGFFKLAGRKEAYYSDGAPSIDFRYWAEKLQRDQRKTVRESRLTSDGAEELLAEARMVAAAAEAVEHAKRNCRRQNSGCSSSAGKQMKPGRPPKAATADGSREGDPSGRAT